MMNERIESLVAESKGNKKKVVKPKTETKVETPVIDAHVPVVEKKQPKIKEQRDLNELVCVRNNLHRKLVYPSKIYAGNEFEWDNFGEENYLELRDLVAMRNSYPTYFRECWVMADDDILEYLGVKKYYEKAIDMEDFDSIFNMKPDELRDLLTDLPVSMKSSVAQRAMQLKAEGVIDSVKTLKVLSETLNYDIAL